MVSKAYYMDARVTNWTHAGSLPGKLETLLSEHANLKEVVKPNEPVAVKMHFGSRGAHRIIRPAFVRRVVEAVREAGGKPFVCDTVRIRGVDYLDVAASNGITADSVRAPVALADGLFGLDCIEVKAGPLMPYVPVASGIHDVPSMIVLTHCKGHVQSGYAGAVKNLAMGCVSGSVRQKAMRGKVGRGGMHTMHRGKVQWERETCTFCGQCVEVCPLDAVEMDESGEAVVLNYDACWSCCRCARVCPEGAMIAPDVGEKFQDALAECAKGVLSTFKPGRVLYLNFLLDIQPECDCMPGADVSVVQDLGILLADNPCVVDLATCDLIEEAEPLPRSAYPAEARAEGKSAWEALHGKTGRHHIEVLGELMGLETTYDIVTVA
ncbi:MAG: DUF362 domain-containing protein [Planctomycetota bacterium]|jgi:uncharacterized Fe-S center protein